MYRLRKAHRSHGNFRLDCDLGLHFDRVAANLWLRVVLTKLTSIGIVAKRPGFDNDRHLQKLAAKDHQTQDDSIGNRCICTSKKRDYEARKAVASISIFISGRISSHTIMVAAGRMSLKNSPTIGNTRSAASAELKILMG